jgi:hypothetical protein
MKEFTHPWLSFMAIKRLKDSIPNMSASNQPFAQSLVKWIMHYEDDIIQGAWYPDKVIKDMGNSHVLKMNPSTQAANQFKSLPATHLMYQHTVNSALKAESFAVDPNDNLPDRCESIAHSIVDNLKMQKWEKKGSPVAPASNHVALLFFMLSHYIADAHMPLHCDTRRFSSGPNVHALIEKKWDDLIKRHYRIDSTHKRYHYDSYGYPLRRTDRDAEYQGSYLKRVEDNLATRPFRIGYGSGNGNTWDFMSAVCQHSYLMAFTFFPRPHDHNTITASNWETLGGAMTFDTMSVAVLSDTIDSIARVWFRVWRRYRKWAE